MFYLLIVITILIAIPTVFLLITSKKDTHLAKLGICLTLVFGILSFCTNNTINANINNNDKVIDSMKSVVEKIEEENYVKEALANAEVSFNEQGYSAAVDIVNNALTKYPENSELKEALEKYKTYKPKLLVDCEWIKNTTDEDVQENTYINDYTEDKFNNTYNTSFSLSNGSVTYYIDKKYSYFSGTVACPKGLNSDAYRESATIFIYDENENYLWSSGDVKIDSEPQFFKVDIQGVEKLTLTWECKGANIWENWGDYATIFDGEFYR